MTLEELSARINQLSNRVNALATSAQITELRTLLNTYKTSTDSDITDLSARLDNHDSILSDHEDRLQALET